MLYATTPLNLAINKNAVSNLLRFCKVKVLQKGCRGKKKRETRVHKRLGENQKKKKGRLWEHKIENKIYLQGVTNNRLEKMGDL